MIVAIPSSLRQFPAMIAVLAALAFFLMTGGTAWGQDKPVADPLVSAASASYEIGTSDVLALSVYRMPDLSITTSVSADGQISLPSVGAVTVAGLTESEAAQKLEDVLKSSNILVSPSVRVVVREVRAHVVMVMGAVARPGVVAIDQPGLLLSVVLARAGAVFDSGSAIVTISSRQGDRTKREQLRMAEIVSGDQDRAVQSNDIVVVQPAPSIYVSGEVNRPGAYSIQPGMTLGQAIALGGGITPRGSSRIHISRKRPDGSQVDIREPNSATPVEANDLITVRTRVF